MFAQRCISDNTLFMAGVSVAIGRRTWQRKKITIKVKRLCWAVCIVVLDFTL
jgi:hypothetical protein